MQVNGVQLAIPGQFAAPFDYLNDIPSGGLDINNDSQIDIIQPCSCRNQAIVENGDNPNSGFFDDQIIVATGISGQEWKIASIINVFNPANLSPIIVGTSIPEVGNSGVYVLPMAHQDAVGFIVAVENTIDHPGMLFGPLLNTCYYPDPIIENLADTYCDTEPDFVLSGAVTSDFDDNFIPFQPETEFWSITRIEDNANYISQTFSPSTLGGGHYLVRYTVNAGSSPNDADNKTGCSITVEKEVEVRNSHVMACNSGINITLNPNVCAVTLTPSLLLADDPEDESLFTIDVMAPGGGSLGNIIPAELAGMDILVRIEDFCSGDFCFTSVTVQDFAAPNLTIPDDIILSCTQDPDTSLTGMASASDCSPFTITYEDATVGSECGNPIRTIFRNWVATDDFGNTTSEVQVISIARGGPSELIFPADIEYECSDYWENPTIIEPTMEGAGIPTLVEADCGLIYTNSDETISLCGDPDASFVIIRTWIVLDLCGNNLFETDANGNDNVQFIRVEDNTPPEVLVDPITGSATLAPQTTGLSGCSSTSYLPPPTVMDECNAYDIEIFTPLGEANYVFGTNGSQGAFVPYPGLELGTHDITYIVTDDCGNETELIVPLTVIDDLQPIMICDNSVSFVLGQNGTGRLLPSVIDEGSRDDCCTDMMQIKLAEEPDSLFRDFIDFHCDVGVFTVVLRVWDCAGNTNECNAQVSVEDPIPPFVQQGVSDVTISCMDDFEPYLSADFSAPVFEDNCEITIDFATEEMIDDCGAGTLVRTWTATDNPENTPASFTQTVTLAMDIDYQVQLPADSSVNCLAMEFPEFAPISSGCEMLATTVLLDTLFPPIDSICFQLVRIYQIINWCEYDGVADPILLPRSVTLNSTPQVGVGYRLRSDGEQLYQITTEGETPIGQATGFYHYQQLINVLDTIPPQINFSELMPFCTSDTLDNCAGIVDFAFSVSDNCTLEPQVSYQLDDFNQPAFADPYGQLVNKGGGNFTISGAYPAGLYAYILTVSDMCGTSVTSTINFVVEDCSAPELSCGSGLQFSLNQEGGLVLTPEELMVMAADNCSAISLSFSAENSMDAQRDFDCDSLGPHNLTVWATDEEGNSSSCEANFSIVDDSTACLQFFNIDGFVITENNLPVGQTIVRLTGPVTEEDTTGQDGKYSFLTVPEGIGYKITPGKNIDFDNGVSTLDLLLMTRHIIGVEPFNSPYKIIAADANRSGTVSTLDVILFRKIVLNVDIELAANTSWRFVPQHYEFPEPSNPFADNFPEDILLDALGQDTSLNFIGIKMGDVNGTVNAENGMAIDERTSPESLTLWAPDKQLKKGEAYEVVLEGDDSQVSGGQLALGWAAEMIAILEVIPLNEEEGQYFGAAIDEENQVLRWSWFQSEGTGVPKFKLLLRAKRNAVLSDVLWSQEEDGLRPEIYVENGDRNREIHPLKLDFKSEGNLKLAFSLAQNAPNPFSNTTQIQFSLPKEEDVIFSVFDVDGVEVFRTEGHFEEGTHQINLNKEVLKDQGIFFYQLNAGKYHAVRKMMLIE